MKPSSLVTLKIPGLFSNLLQNSFESIEKSGKIDIWIWHENGSVKIEIQDSGRGIPNEVIGRLFQSGATHGKKSGTGLGLNFVKSCLIAWGGGAELKSSSPMGTIFSMNLPIAVDFKDLFIGPEIVRSQDGFVLLDDQAEVMKSLWGTAKIKSFTNPQDFMDWWAGDGKLSSEAIVLDLHLSKYISGLDVLREIGLRERTYFSTSDFLNDELKETAREYSVKIIPKQLV